MKLIEYMAQNSVKKVSSKIAGRWDSRIKPRSLWDEGREGARTYIEILNYGGGIKAPKCFQLGQMALNEGHVALAEGFFIYASKLEGVALEDLDAVNPPVA